MLVLLNAQPKQELIDLPPPEIFDVGRPLIAQRYFASQSLAPNPVAAPLGEPFETTLIVSGDGNHLEVKEQRHPNRSVYIWVMVGMVLSVWLFWLPLINWLVVKAKTH